MFLFEKHFKDFFSEEEEVKTSEHHCRLGHVEVNHRVKPKGLSCRTEEKPHSKSEHVKLLLPRL